MSYTFTQVSCLWKTDKRQWIKPSTYAEYVYHINKHILPYFGGLTASSIKEDSIQQFVNRLFAQGLSLNTIRDSLMILRMILKYGTKLGAWPHIEFAVHYPHQTEKKQDVPVIPAADYRTLLTYLQQNFSFRRR